MADILSRSLLRAVRWAVDAARMELAADEVLCDLGSYRSTLEMVGMVANPTAYLAESAALLESEIRAREVVQARVRRVVSNGECST